MSVFCDAVVVEVSVAVSLIVTVSAGGVIVVTGVLVKLATTLLVKVKAYVLVGTELTDLGPRRVVQKIKDLVESAKA